MILKKRLINLILFLLVCVLPIMSIIMVHNLSLSKTIQMMNNGVFGNKSSIITTGNSDGNCKKIIYDKFSSEGISCGIYLDDKSNDEFNIRYLAYTKKYKVMPMISGRFFDKKDFTENNNVAVIGKNVKNTYKKSSETYIQIDGIEYKVIGVLGYEDDTPFDNYIFINLLSCKNDELKLYIIDFMDNTSQESFDEYIKDLSSKIKEIETLSETASFSETVEVDFSTFVYFVGLFVSCILCILLISLQWLIYQRREIAIRRLVGASKEQITFFVLSKYIFYLLTSFIVGVIYCSYFYPSYKASFLEAYIFSSIIILLFMFINIGIIKRDSIEEVIRS